MQSILDDVLNTIKSIDFKIDIPKNHILSEYPIKIPSFTKPYIFVSELNNITDYETITDNKENYTLLSYEIEIYSKQQKVDGKILSPTEVIKLIGFEINDVLFSKLGLIRIGAPAPIPYTYDNTVKRYVLTFEGKLDLAHGYIYRR